MNAIVYRVGGGDSHGGPDHFCPRALRLVEALVEEHVHEKTCRLVACCFFLLGLSLVRWPKYCYQSESPSSPREKKL